MKKIIRYFLLVIVLATTGGYVYWQYNKKKIIRHSIESAIEKKSDSLYYIHYDSSHIDEINGNAAFYNVSLQSDSAQEKILSSNDSLPNTLYSIKVKEVSVTGVDVPGLLANQQVAAKKITLTGPRIQIIKTGNDYYKPFTYDDTLALYKKILGKFKAIKADVIEVVNGTVVMITRKGKPLTTFENINVSLNKFLVDSAHNYQNIISYFIKDIRVTVENVQLPESKSHTRVNMEKISYDAVRKTLEISKVQQYKTSSTKPIIDLSNIKIDSLNTDAFILNQQLKAGSINCDGGLITIYRKAKTANSTATKNKEISFSSDLVVEAAAKSLKLGKTKVVVVDTLTSKGEPLVLNDVKFMVVDGFNITDGNTIGDLISGTNWKLFSSGFSFSTKDKRYNIIIGPLELDNATSVINIKQIHVRPYLSEEAFMKASPYQTDRFDLTFNNIQFRGADFKRMIADNEIIVDNVSLQAILKVYDDRTLPAGPNSKVGKYPHQMLMDLDVPIYVKTVKINDGFVSYREKELLTNQVGEVVFTHVNSTISNLTNIDTRIKQNPALLFDASAFFLGKTKLTTQWNLTLNSRNGAFVVKGEMDDINAMDLNAISRPMALTEIKSGVIHKLVFNETGMDTKSSGHVSSFLYSNLKIELLKKGSEETKKRGLTSFLANLILINNNPQNGKTRQANMELDRDIHRSFFNLVWKTLFKGIKNVTIGKDD